MMWRVEGEVGCEGRACTWERPCRYSSILLAMLCSPLGEEGSAGLLLPSSSSSGSTFTSSSSFMVELESSGGGEVLLLTTSHLEITRMNHSRVLKDP